MKFTTSKHTPLKPNIFLQGFQLSFSFYDGFQPTSSNYIFTYTMRATLSSLRKPLTSSPFQNWVKFSANGLPHLLVTQRLCFNYTRHIVWGEMGRLLWTVNG